MLYEKEPFFSYLFFSAFADDPSVCCRTSIMPVPNYVPLRGGANISGQTCGSTCTEYSFRVNNGMDEDVVYYRYAVAILDNTHPNGAADTMYDEFKRSPSTSDLFSYTFYTTGTYGIFAYRYDADMNPVLWTYGGKSYDFVYKQIKIETDDPTSNPLTQAVNAIADECLAESTDDYTLALAINNKLCEIIDYDNSKTYYSPGWNKRLQWIQQSV